ncbi:MAG: class I mannose-6-phosphate isomerase [Lentisphaeria bacterium]|nr:class I mannose-6-phosphate isomerase [Lentisphaeria bacterium]
MDFPDAAQLYPLIFKPIYQERIWGGTLMQEVLGRDLPETKQPIGESWEVTDRPDAVSVVVNGPLAGCTLHELLLHYGTALTGGTERFEQFPLLVKLIDAGERLSLQVHPDEVTCRQLGEGAEPKTEMWYIIAARREGCILAGLDPRATLVQTKELLHSPEVEQMLRKHPSVPGDGYFIPSGTLHAIGAGNLILEIQQNSDTTYRLSDWGRVDAEGKSRTLHVEKGLASVHFTDRSNPRIVGVSDSAAHNRKFPLVKNCRHFTVDDLRLAGVWHDTTAGSSFHLLSCVDGSVTVKLANGCETELKTGETALVPYACGAYQIIPAQTGGTAAVIRTTL